MAPKLGEILVKAGKITAEDLDEALASQIFFGGKLGTHLIEMGCIDENELMRFLSRITGIPAVTPGQLDAVKPETIALISPELAERYRLIPLHLGNKRLEVAMADPIDFVSIDEISFATGFIIIPRLASEPTIARFLKMYYQIERKEQLLRIAGESRHRPRPEKPKPEEEQPPKPEDSDNDNNDIVIFPSYDAFKGFHIDQDEPVPEPPTTDTAFPTPPARAEQASLAEEIGALLCDAEDRDAIAALLLRYVGAHFRKAALFIIKKELATGWQAVVRQRPVTGFGGLVMPLQSSSVLNNVVEQKTPFAGKALANQGDVRIRECLGGGSDDAIALPLLLLNRVVAVLYLSESAETADMAELQKMLIKTSMALEILILKNKILMT